ncbi:MAG: TadE-like protein [Gemmataceae bacterium]|nr:TadE-like protein [Gemmataceae bacterium]
MLARRTTRRRGVTIVESALVLGVFLMVLFGLFEYCRFLMVLHITDNATRDGARYAVVNLNKPSNFNTTDYTDGSGVLYPSVVNYTTARMGGVDKQIKSFKVAVYPCDPYWLKQSPPVVLCASTLSTGLAPPPYNPDPFSPSVSSDPNYPGWNASTFPNRLAVTVQGTYQPITPVLLIMPSTIPINITAVMGSEG